MYKVAGATIERFPVNEILMEFIAIDRVCYFFLSFKRPCDMLAASTVFKVSTLHWRRERLEANSDLFEYLQI